jgi:hypothetical protein
MWGIAVLAFVCAIEFIVILALDRYAHGLAHRVDRLEAMMRKPVATPPHVGQLEIPRGAHE